MNIDEVFFSTCGTSGASTAATPSLEDLLACLKDQTPPPKPGTLEDIMHRAKRIILPPADYYRIKTSCGGLVEDEKRGMMGSFYGPRVVLGANLLHDIGAITGTARHVPGALRSAWAWPALPPIYTEDLIAVINLKAGYLIPITDDT